MKAGVEQPDGDETSKHVSAIAALSEVHKIPPAVVAELYERELARIKRDAVVTSYLPIFVARRVGEILRRRSSPDAAGAEEGTASPDR